MRYRETLILEKNNEPYDENGFLYITPKRYYNKNKHHRPNAVSIWIYPKGEILTTDFKFAKMLIRKIKKDGWDFLFKQLKLDLNEY